MWDKSRDVWFESKRKSPTQMDSEKIMNLSGVYRAPLLPPPQSGRKNSNSKKKPQPGDGPPVTVFVGNITPRAPDAMIRYVLTACGPVVNWKSVSSFGFCEFSSPEAGLRCVRLLHDREVGGKHLVARVDAKTEVLLDQYKNEQRKKVQMQEGGVREEGAEDYLDEQQRVLDASTLVRIQQIISEYQDDMNNYEAIRLEEQIEKRNRILQEADIEEEKRDVIHREIGKFREIMKKQEEAKEVSRRTKDSEDVAKERSDKERDSRRDRDAHKDRGKSRDKDKKSSRRRTRSRSHDREKDRERDKDRDREREREKEKEREREREREQREREKERERERERERDKDREREREREAAVRASSGPGGSRRDSRKEKEMEDEARERKRADKLARDKEAAYQERLRNWETRERRKAKDHDKDKERERCREEAREREAKKLKEFLEDYDDERDDSKYYKGKELQRRLAERVREADVDTADRQKEKVELEELRAQLFGSELQNPAEEFEKIKRERDEMYKTKILIDVNLEQSLQREKEEQRMKDREEAREQARERQRRHQERFLQERASRELPEHAEPIDSDSSGDRGGGTPPLSEGGSSPAPIMASPPRTPESTTPPRPDMGNSMSPPHMEQHQRKQRNDEMDGRSLTPPPRTIPAPVTPQPYVSTSNSPISISMNIKHHNNYGQRLHNHHNSPNHAQDMQSKSKRRKLDVRDVFNTEEEEGDAGDGTGGPQRRRPLVPLDYSDLAHGKVSEARTPPEPHKGDRDKEKDEHRMKERDNAKQQEEKRKQVKSIIDKIPTQKEALFAFKLDCTLIDMPLMEKRIRPWINKKIIEYIGEPEPTLVDFICSKVLAGSPPQGILDDVQMVLDEEAEVFVVKMWRLLIYEVEANKMGISK